MFLYTKGQNKESAGVGGAGRDKKLLRVSRPGCSREQRAVVNITTASLHAVLFYCYSFDRALPVSTRPELY